MSDIKDYNFLWWTFIWPIYRIKIRKLWERGHITLAAKVIQGIFNDNEDTSKYIVGWLSKTHKWSIK